MTPATSVNLAEILAAAAARGASLAPETEGYLALAVGDKPTDLRAAIGAMSAEHGCWVVVRTHFGDKSAFPDGIRPAAIRPAQLLVILAQ